MLRTILFSVFVVSLLILQTPSIQADAGPSEIRVKLAGLVCDFCAQAIQKTFAKQDEVAGIKIDLTTKLMTIELKPDARLDDQTIEKLVKNAGYNVVSIDREKITSDVPKE